MNLAKTEIQEQNPKKKRQSPMIKKRNVTSNEERDIPNRGRNPQRSTSGNELQRDIFRDRHNKRVHGANRVGEGAEEARKAEISRDFKWGDGRRGEAIGGAIGEAIGELIIYLAISFVEMVVLLVVVLSFGWYSRNSYRPDGIGEGRGAFGSLFQNIRFLFFFFDKVVGLLMMGRLTIWQDPKWWAEKVKLFKRFLKGMGFVSFVVKKTEIPVKLTLLFWILVSLSITSEFEMVMTLVCSRIFVHNTNTTIDVLTYLLG
eukprot:TRINITY_DN313_c0_g1_i2.p1 TRINITY_DN313_c0_g1~~TRINITY_DN313_c0_g1_i2.p1  ORF type:complete len:259 (+),score=31.83 TRINITY_DN313_c0_g1_i2:87-863(+)